MGVQEFINYNSYLEIMDKNLEIWSQPVSLYFLSNKKMLGYENLSQYQSDETIRIKDVGNDYSVVRTKAWINFNTKKSTLYKHGIYYPEGQDNNENGPIISAVFPSNSGVQVGCYVRTATPEATSVWGDLIFKVERIADEGKYMTLSRFCYLTPTANEDLHFALDF